LALAVGGVVAATALSSLGAPAVPSPAPSQPPPTSVRPIVAEVTLAAPATATPAVSVECPQVSLLGFEHDGDEVRWAIYNGQEQVAIRVTDFLFGVPEGQSLVDVRLGSTSLRDPASTDTGSPIPELVTLGSEVTTVAPGATLPLALVYAFADTAPGYQVIVIFEEGCSVETVW
jgi:hypothetical protein